jgi:FkbM family methyltransferase
MNILSVVSRMNRRNLWGLRKYINGLYYDPQTVVLSLDKYDYITVDGCIFKFNELVFDIPRVQGNPWFEGTQPDDIALDIGANIGAVAIPLAKVVGQVFAVEPLFDDLLNENIALNKLKNIQVFKYALGDSAGNNKVSYRSRQGPALFRTFAEMKDMCGGTIDYLKCDCEGGEWSIKPEECEGIRELRIEFHIRRKQAKNDRVMLEKWRRWLDNKGYESHLTPGPDIVFFPGTPFKRLWLLRASRKTGLL